MSDLSQRFTFADVEKHIRKRSFGTISVVDLKGRPHSTGIIFGMSTPDAPVYFYIVTQKSAAKVRYIENNPNVALMITFPHHWLRFIPDNAIMVRGVAEFVSLDDKGFQDAFSQSRMLRMNLQMDHEVMKEAIVVRIRPRRTVHCYGIGIGLNEMRKDPTKARYKVEIPKNRFAKD